MELKGLLIFTRVVQEGSFSGAARALKTPRSTISRQVSQLEAELKARLLQRTTRKLSLTEVGRQLYEHGVRIQEELVQAEQAVARLQTEPMGLLRVTTPLTFGFLGPIIAEFLKRYPQVQMEVLCTDRRLDLVQEGFDLALRAGLLGDSSLIGVQVGEVRPLLVASADYLEKNAFPTTPEGLKSHDCLAFGNSRWIDWKFQRGKGAARVRLHARLVLNDFDLLREATAEGLGIARLPDYLCRDALETGRLLRVLPEWQSPMNPVHALYPSKQHLSAKVRAFLDIVRDRLQLSQTP